MPIVVGGHTEMAARRAARYGDGFFPGVADDRQLDWLLGIMRDECEKVGRDPKTIEITAGRAAPDVDSVKRYRDLGVVALHRSAAGLRPRRRHARASRSSAST